MLGLAEGVPRLVRQQVRARSSGEDQGFGQECDVHPLTPGLLEAADRLPRRRRRCSPVRRLREMQAKLQAEADKLDPGRRARIEGVVRPRQPLRTHARGVAGHAARPARRA